MQFESQIVRFSFPFCILRWKDNFFLTENLSDKFRQLEIPVDNSFPPIASVIVPYYENASTIEECLLSILSQSLPEIEVIVVNDASPDSEYLHKVIDKFHDIRLRLINHTENRGLAAARNTGISDARADWILPVDSDDRLSPHFLSEVVNVLSQNPAVDAIFTDHLYFGDFSYVKNRYVQTIEEVLDHHSIPGAGTMYRRWLWERVGGYCEAPIFRAGNEDWDFWLAVYELGFTPFHIPESLYEYRRYQSSMVNRLKAVDYRVRMLMYRRHHRLFNKYKKGCLFLSKGFENSAYATLKQSKPFLAGVLAVCGLVLNLNNRKLARLALDSFASLSTFEKVSGQG